MKTISKETYRARKLRKDQTDFERLLWQLLRNKGCGGIKFRRQQPIGQYIVDFVSYECMLVVELDGGQHNAEDAAAYDSVRTTYLEALGYRVLRFWNNEVAGNIDGVFEAIQSAVPSPQPSPPGRGSKKVDASLREREQTQTSQWTSKDTEV